MSDDDYNPDDCAGGLCPPRNLPARWRRFDHTLWGRRPGELWWRRELYAERAVAERRRAEYEAREPDAEFAVRPNDAGPPGEGG